MDESVLKPKDENLERCHVHRMAVDNMLCRFNAVCPAERINRVCHILENKGQQMRGIVKIFDKQPAPSGKIARQVPVISLYRNKHSLNLMQNKVEYRT